MKYAMHHKNAAKITASVLLLLQITAMGWAAPISPRDREEQNQRARQEAIEKERRENQADVFLQQKKVKEENLTLPVEEISFHIGTIQLAGEDTEKFSKLKDYLKKYEGKRMGIQGIQLMISRATNLLLGQGFVTTRILLQEQDLNTGTMKLLLLPGKIESIEFEDKKLQGNWKSEVSQRKRTLNSSFY